MFEFYPQIKLFHMSVALLSGALFALRGAFALGGARWPQALPVKLLSYGIDTALLTAALTLLTALDIDWQPDPQRDGPQVREPVDTALRELLIGGDTGLIHADVLRENVLITEHSVSLIDFDDSGFGFRLYDLGTALVQVLALPEFPALRDALMAGYGTTDVAMVDAFTMARTLASVGWTMPRLLPDDPIHQSHLARAVRCADERHPSRPNAWWYPPKSLIGRNQRATAPPPSPAHR